MCMQPNGAPPGVLVVVTRDEEFGDFVRVRSPALLRFAHMLVGDAGAAEDVLQTTLLRVYSSWPKVASADDPLAYVRRILINCCTNQRNQRWFSREGKRWRP